MFLNGQLTEAISIAIRQYSGNDAKFQLLKPVSGGCINKCFQILYGNEYFFLKLNSSLKLPGMFMAEAEGLKRLGLTKAIKVPKVSGYGTSFDEQFLVLEWIEQGINTISSQQELGRALAKLHKHTDSQFRLDHDNYMGSLTQSNKRNHHGRHFLLTSV